MARRKFTGRVCWELRHSVLVARFGEKAVYGVCVGGSLVAVIWWLALASRKHSGVVCWPERGHHKVLWWLDLEKVVYESRVGKLQVTVLVAHFGETDAPDRLHIG